MPDLDDLVKRARKLADRYRIDDGTGFRLAARIGSAG